MYIRLYLKSNISLTRDYKVNVTLFNYKSFVHKIVLMTENWVQEYHIEYDHGLDIEKQSVTLLYQPKVIGPLLSVKKTPTPTTNVDRTP